MTDNDNESKLLTKLLEDPPKTWVPLPATPVAPWASVVITCAPQRRLMAPIRLWLDCGDDAGNIMIGNVSFNQEIQQSAPGAVTAKMFEGRNTEGVSSLLPMTENGLSVGAIVALTATSYCDHLVTVRGALIGGLETYPRLTARAINLLDNSLLKLNRGKPCDAFAPETFHGARVYMPVASPRCLLHVDHEGDHYAHGFQWA